VAAFLLLTQRLGPARLAALGAVAVGLIAFFVFFTGRLSNPDMAVLYANLDIADSGRIAAQLDSLKVPYDVDPDGARIMVPANQVARVRMSLAQQGLPQGGSMGYEIFDQGSSLGTTSFVQNINHLRALEGELARSIRTLGPVTGARVHLVLPRREVFSRDMPEPSASIVLSLRTGAQLTLEQISAIRQLVASAVPKLSPTHVAIVDDRGTLLARGNDEKSEGSMAAASVGEVRAAYESRLARSIEEMLTRSVGYGNVRVEVAAEMDFDRVTTTSETFDPDGQVLRSSQIVSEATQARGATANNGAVTVGNNLPDRNQGQAGGEGESSQRNRTEETNNYEISKTEKVHLRETGTIRRLTVAVLVDGVYTTDADGTATYQPRSDADLAKLTALVKGAVGYDESRGDKVEVVNLRFSRPESEFGADDAGSGLFSFEKADYFRIAEIAVLGAVAVLVILLVVRPVVTRVFEVAATTPESEGQNLLQGPAPAQALAGPAGSGTTTDRPVAAGAPPAEDGSLIDISRVEGRVRASSLNQIGEIIERHPEEAVSIMRHWMYQET